MSELEQELEPLNSAKQLRKSIRRAAMNMLARRDHSQKELSQKLYSKFEDKQLVQAVIEQLGDESLQSDSRFAEAYVRFRASKGYGPERIFMELVQKGINESLANNLIEQSGINWFDLLEQQYEKKFHSLKPQGLEEKAKMMRFLTYRGFSSHLVGELLS